MVVHMQWIVNIPKDGGMQRHEHWQHLSRNSIRHTRSTYCNRWASHPRLYRCIFKTKDTNVYQSEVPEWDK